MGNQKQKWTSEEEDALVAGVDKHGTGKWKNILKDPEFTPLLIHRSNIDLKDKWRNMNMSFTASVPGSKDKIRALKVKAITAAPILAIPNGLLALPPPENEHSASLMVDVPNCPNGKSTPRYNAMIYEALTSIEDRSGSDLSTISSYIQQKYEVPPNVRRLLTSKLRRLVSQGKLEKVQNRYRITDTVSSAKILSLMQRDTRCPESPPRGFRTPVSAFISSEETEEAAARTAAYLIADADNKAILAAEAVKEAEAFQKIADDMLSLYTLTVEIYQRFE